MIADLEFAGEEVAVLDRSERLRLIVLQAGIGDQLEP